MNKLSCTGVMHDKTNCEYPMLHQFGVTMFQNFCCKIVLVYFTKNAVSDSFLVVLINVKRHKFECQTV